MSNYQEEEVTGGAEIEDIFACYRYSESEYRQSSLGLPLAACATRTSSVHLYLDERAEEAPISGVAGKGINTVTAGIHPIYPLRNSRYKVDVVAPHPYPYSANFSGNASDFGSTLSLNQAINPSSTMEELLHTSEKAQSSSHSEWESEKSISLHKSRFGRRTSQHDFGIVRKTPSKKMVYTLFGIAIGKSQSS